MSLKHWPIMGKIALVILILGGCAGLATFISAQMLRGQATEYQGLLKGEARANVALARVSRQIAYMERSIFQAITATTAEGNKTAETNFKNGQEVLRQRFEAAKAALPERAGEFDRLHAKILAGFADKCGQAMRLALDSTDMSAIEQATALMNTVCAPAIQQVALEVVKVVDDTTASVDANIVALEAASGREILVLSGGTAAAILVSLVLAFLISRYGIVQPLALVIGVMGRLEKGELKVEVPGTDRRDEIGRLAGGVEIFRQGLVEAEHMREAARLEEQRAAERLRAERHAIADTFEASMGALATAFTKSSSEVSEAARNLSSTAEETSRQAQAVGHAAEEASTNVETVAASTEEMSASIREIGIQVSNAARIAAAAAEETGRTQSEINELSQSAAKIGEVVDLITNIAGQTNLLALNATIEAARAGEMGKGFAVVAQEVKQLAAQTAKATEEIASKVSEIQQATNRSVDSIDRIVSTISDIRTSSSAIASAVEEQGAATREIAVNTQQAAQGTGTVNHNISGVGRAAEMTGAASTQLMSLSSALAGQAGQLQVEVERVVRNLRAG
ncbi:methyl-accepting chemotaxis protein [Azorhizobium doebereinerae]|uniref:methyl-accepting chemotaxis protein n=1 Tax=Azorhizobium doebereinerae TaxID=281091 RepID=UPI000429BBF2|nr:HAMP domain-containing methyl-accepting chemotaxis protein [Azorhizobium doebereinerae]